jgi:hypothetical protein
VLALLTRRIGLGFTESVVVAVADMAEFDRLCFLEKRLERCDLMDWLNECERPSSVAPPASAAMLSLFIQVAEKGVRAAKSEKAKKKYYYPRR